MSSANENELTVFGLSKSMRSGLITSIFAIQFIAIAYLFIAFSGSEKNKQEMLSKSEKEKLEMQEKMYERMIDYMKPTRDKMEKVAERADTAVSKVNRLTEQSDISNHPQN